MAILQVRKYGDPILRRRAEAAGICADVARSEWVRLNAEDEEGRPVGIEARGLFARVLQHEVDHLDGVLFIDRLDPVQRNRIKRRIRKDGLPEHAPHRAFAL